MQKCTFKRYSFKQKHCILWSVWNWAPVWPDMCNIAGSDLQLKNLMGGYLTPSLLPAHLITQWFLNVLQICTRTQVCQVHQGHDYSRTKPAVELYIKVTVLQKGQGRHSKSSADQCMGKTTLGSLPESSLLASFVSLLLLFDLKLIVIKRMFRYLRAATCPIKAIEGT